MEFTLAIAGFGTWRIAYSVTKKRWELAYNVRAVGEQWVLCGDFLLAETAAIAVAERKTHARGWDGLRFATPTNDITQWKTDASEGVQQDAAGGGD